MQNVISCPFPQTGSDSFLKDLLVLEDFKCVVNKLFEQTDYVKHHRFYIHEPYKYVFVKLYSLISEISIHQASQALNDTLKGMQPSDSLFTLKMYSDKKRQRRLVPHQTEIDRLFRCLSEKDVQMIFGGLLNFIVYKILSDQCPRRSWLSMVDNTKYPYYGKIDPLKHIGSNHLPGTHHAWMFQGLSVQSQDMHLYTFFNSLTLGIYRALQVPNGIDLQQALGLSLSGMVFDREFYRATLVSELHHRKIAVLFPTKKYPWVKHHMTQYLKGIGSMVVGNLFAQSSQQYPYQSVAFVRLVIIGKDNQGAWEVREKYRQGVYTYHQAMLQLRGFFTSYKPWQNDKAWARFLVREYKRRWNIESGFAVLNRIHESGRERIYTAKLVNLYCRGVLYDWWQSWRLNRKRLHYHHRSFTLNAFRYYVQQEILSNLRPF